MTLMDTQVTILVTSVFHKIFYKSNSDNSRHDAMRYAAFCVM